MTDRIDFSDNLLNVSNKYQYLCLSLLILNHMVFALVENLKAGIINLFDIKTRYSYCRNIMSSNCFMSIK